MIPFAELPQRFLDQLVTWTRVDPTVVGVFAGRLVAGRMGVAIVLDTRPPEPVANVAFLLRPGVALFTFHGTGSVAEIEARCRRFVADVTSLLVDVVVATRPEAVQTSPPVLPN